MLVPSMSRKNNSGVESTILVIQDIIKLCLCLNKKKVLNDIDRTADDKKLNFVFNGNFIRSNVFQLNFQGRFISTIF